MAQRSPAGADRRRFVVLDRDGTIIVEQHYLSEPDYVELLPGASKALGRLKELNLGLVVITNQSGIGREFFDQARLDLIHQRVGDLLAAEGVHLDRIFFCPHTPDDDCLCRKPRPRLLELAAEELDFDLKSCFVIGDKASDIEMGRRVGATTFLVSTGYGAEVAKNGSADADYTVEGLPEAATVIQGLL